MEKDKVKIIALTASTEMASSIAKSLGINVTESEVIHFADGEIIFESKQSLRCDNVYIIQSTCSPVTEHLMEILLCLDACKRASAKSITCIIPYFGYARQDRMAKPRQPISAKLVADLLTTAGADRVIATDLHTSQIQGFFSIPVDDVIPTPLFYRYFKKMKLNDVVCVSPDHGGVTRCSRLANRLDAPIAIIDKRRPKPNVAECIGIVGDIIDKNCIIVDDICDTAGTLCMAANKLKELGAKNVYAVVTHPVLSRDAVQKIEDSAIVKLITTDTIELPEEKKSPKIVVLSLVPLYAKMIEALEEGKSVADLFEEYTRSALE